MQLSLASTTAAPKHTISNALDMVDWLHEEVGGMGYREEAADLKESTELSLHYVDLAVKELGQVSKPGRGIDVKQAVKELQTTSKLIEQIVPLIGDDLTEQQQAVISELADKADKHVEAAYAALGEAGRDQ